MATTYSTLYHNITTSSPRTKLTHRERQNDLFMSNYFMVNEENRPRKILRNSFSADNIYCDKSYEQNSNSVFSTSTPRARKTSSILRDIIVESVSENMEIFEDKNCENENNNVEYYNDVHTQDGSERKVERSQTIATKARQPKKVYRHRKHHSDFGVVFQLEHFDDDSFDEEIDDLMNTENIETRKASFPSEDHVDGPRHLRADSHGNLSGSAKIRKTSSQRDITDTKMYKDIYADNLRLYGFLVAKKLGISQKSPDQLRRTYQKGRQKAMERRERANTSATETRSEQMNDSSHHIPIPATRERSSTTSSSDSNASTSPVSTSDLRSNRYTSSLSDLSNIAILEKHKKPATSVIRRRKGSKLPSDPTKRLSAPLMNPVALSDLETISVSSLRKQMASLSVPDLSQRTGGNSDSVNKELTPPPMVHYRKMSDETSKRHQEAKARQEWRLSRIKSFEGVLSQANSLMRDMKTKQTGEKTGEEDGTETQLNMVDKQRQESTGSESEI